jgi:hypothetical protein
MTVDDNEVWTGRIELLEERLKSLIIHDINACARVNAPYPFELWGAINGLNDPEVNAWAARHAVDD